MASVVTLIPSFTRNGRILCHYGRRALHTTTIEQAKKIGGGAGKMAVNVSQKIELDVEMDPDKLTKFCCGANIYTTGQDPELKPDSAYPDWLWTLRVDRKPPDLSELDPDTYQYWGRLRKLHRRHISQLMKSKKIK